jgi:DNA-binding transcriptional LysR family regulator
VELRHLRYFVAIAEERSFSRAAERVWVAQPALSTQIRQLEGELGVKLFERHPRGVDLTAAGEEFLERARVALAAIETAAATGRELEAGVTGKVRLGIAGGPRWRHLLPLLRRFTRERPGVELTIIEAYAGTLWHELRERRLDAVVAPAGQASPDLKTLELGSEPWVALIGGAHRLASTSPIAAADLDGERIALTGHRDDAALDAAITELLAELGVVAEHGPGIPGPVLHAAVAENDVIALTTAPDPLPAGVFARRLAPPRTLSFELLWRSEAPSAALAGLISAAARGAHERESVRPLVAVA